MTKPAPTHAPGGPFRVLVVDDSAVIRGVIGRWLEEDPKISVIATAANGEMALRCVERQPVELVILDIEMPVMDGLTALPKLIAARPGLQVIMASTLTKRNADISLRALQQGAADYVPKPESSRDTAASMDFRRILVDKVHALAAAGRQARGEPLPRRAAIAKANEQQLPDTAKGHGSSGPASEARATPASPPIKLRPWSAKKTPEIIAIGSSTGGPQALFEVFRVLKDHLDVPIVITQHMPPTFTAILADHLARQTQQKFKEAEDGEVLAAGTVYIAPGGKHLLIHRRGNQPVAELTQTPPENFCRPSVDPMFRSLAKSYGSRVAAVMLTGMGQDGLVGANDLIDTGATLIAQDEATSVVWGMPGAVAKAGICHAILPLKEIAPKVAGLLKGGAV